jgi:hypothetical protein
MLNKFENRQSHDYRKNFLTGRDTENICKAQGKDNFEEVKITV